MNEPLFYPEIQSQEGMRYKENEAEEDKSQHGQDRFAAGSSKKLDEPAQNQAWDGAGKAERMYRRLQSVEGSPPAFAGCTFQSVGTSWVPQWCPHRSLSGSWSEPTGTQSRIPGS